MRGYIWVADRRLHAIWTFYGEPTTQSFFVNSVVDPVQRGYGSNVDTNLYRDVIDVSLMTWQYVVHIDR